jgi:hypothetical protein
MLDICVKYYNKNIFLEMCWVGGESEVGSAEERSCEH